MVWHLELLKVIPRKCLPVFPWIDVASKPLLTKFLPNVHFGSMDSKHFETIRKLTPTKAKLKKKLILDDAASTIFTKLISKLGLAVLLRLTRYKTDFPEICSKLYFYLRVIGLFFNHIIKKIGPNSIQLVLKIKIGYKLFI